jgi:long-chain acyl-CoA synthetase
VRLTHGNLLSSVESVAGECVPIDPDDTLLLVLPLFHIYALNSLMCTSLYSGGEIKILEEPNPKRVITNLMHENIDIFAGVPSMYRMIYDQYKENAREPNLKYAICAGAPLSEDTRSNIVEDMGINMVKGWGMTEASTGTMEPVRGLKKGPGCVGLPLPGIDIKIVDPEDHSSTRVSSSNLSPYGVESKHIEGLDEDQRTGEVALRGPQVFEGYHKLPEKNDEVFDGEGWFYTGDILQVDKDGYFWMVDRADDMIIVGGENVYPTEVENALHEHPDVAEATVVGVPYEVKGEAPVAFVVLKEGTEREKDLTEKELRKFSLEHTAKYAHPRKIFFVNELPHSATGKVEKYKLEEKAEERIGTLGSSEKL